MLKPANQTDSYTRVLSVLKPRFLSRGGRQPKKITTKTPRRFQTALNLSLSSSKGKRQSTKMREVLSISVRPPPSPSTAQHTSVASCKRRTGARPGSAKFLWFEAKSVALRTRGPMQRSALCSRPVSPLQAHHAPCGCVTTAQCCGALVARPASLASRGEARKGHARTHVGFKWGPLHPLAPRPGRGRGPGGRRAPPECQTGCVAAAL